ncbi:hypothetical protein EAI_08250 [Harpegnathos saltator]|uniref:Uncharacterized protein n=1 Tax=Harpegnathos saltator TaxID=610380 RepID=E2BEG1_HARSA|nr:hypothetical protein EAI_08250 [Harpegnathos saltator]
MKFFMEVLLALALLILIVLSPAICEDAEDEDYNDPWGGIWNRTDDDFGNGPSHVVLNIPLWQNITKIKGYTKMGNIEK